MVALNPFGYFEKAIVKKLWGGLSQREQRSDINGWLRVNPGGTEKQARKALSDGRRSGKLFRHGTQARNADQENRTIVYQDRSKRSQVAAERRKRWRGQVNHDRGPVDVKYKRPEVSRYTDAQYADAETRAYRNMKAKLGDYFQFDPEMTRKRLTKTSMEWLNWIADATEDQLVDLAEVDGSIRQSFSPLFYH